MERVIHLRPLAATLLLPASEYVQYCGEWLGMRWRGAILVILLKSSRARSFGRVWACVSVSPCLCLRLCLCLCVCFVYPAQGPGGETSVDVTMHTLQPGKDWLWQMLVAAEQHDHVGRCG